MKYKYYVGIINSRKVSYVTEVHHSNKTALWETGKPAKAMGMHEAENLVFGLCCNGYPATVLKMPDFMEPANVRAEGCEKCSTVRPKYNVCSPYENLKDIFTFCPHCGRDLREVDDHE